MTAGVTIALTTVGAMGASAALSRGPAVGDEAGDHGQLPGAPGSQLSGIPQRGTSSGTPTNGSQVPLLPQLQGSRQGTPADDGPGRDGAGGDGGDGGEDDGGAQTT